MGLGASYGLVLQLETELANAVAEKMKQYEVYVHKGKPIWKIITGILFSHLGLIVLCIGYGAMGE